MSVVRPFRRVVVTGVECSGKTTFSRLLADHLGWAWVPEAARLHPDVRSGSVSERTFDQLHDTQTHMAAKAKDTHEGVVCDTGTWCCDCGPKPLWNSAGTPSCPLNHVQTCTSSVLVSNNGKTILCAPCQILKTALPWSHNIGHT